MRYTDEMVFSFIKDVKAAKGTLQKQELVKGYYALYGNQLVQFLRDCFSPFIKFNISKKTIENHLAFINKDLMYQFDNISDMIDYLIETDTSSNENKISLCSFIESYNDEDAEYTLDDVKSIFLRNMRFGLDIKGINKALGFKAVPVFDVQLCKPLERLEPGDYLIEPKLDGVRCITIANYLPKVENFDVRFFTRNGTELLGYNELASSIASLLSDSPIKESIMFDGEIYDTCFDGTMNNLFRKSNNKTGVYNIFDIMYLREFSTMGCAASLVQRKENLKFVMSFKNPEFSSITSIPFHIVRFSDRKQFDEEVSEYHSENIANGFEGSIIKRADSVYTFKRDFSWQKLKPFDTIDLPIEEIIEGDGKFKDMAGSVVVTHKGKPVNVGSGFSDDLRKDMWDNPEDYIGTYIEIQYQEVTKDNSLRFPSFKRIRRDK